ncbi:MAG: formimidoylglutamate deiminase [Nitriliruptoraceae bacterium]
MPVTTTDGTATTSVRPSAYVCEHAWLPPGWAASEVVIEVSDGRLTRVEPGGVPPDGAERLPGLVLPGMANAHSHAFHRALRGRTHGRRGSFWTWRELMYDVAARLDPDSYHLLARATFAEMALAGFTSVGEFHYLHHGPDATPYPDANEFGEAVIVAAREAGLRIALLDTCYLASGPGRPTEGVQRRFDDGDADRWADRVGALASRHAEERDVVVGAAIHSVRAVPAEQLPVVASWASERDVPLHVHVSEQPAENEACFAAYGCTPTELLSEAGALGPRTSAVHATHVSAGDLARLGTAGATICLCPTTERDLADGVGPADRMLRAGVHLSLGTDSHALIDPFEEARAVELDLRLASLERGHIGGPALLDALTDLGQASLGFRDAGRLTPGCRADLVAVDVRSVRTAGLELDDAADALVFSAGAADVTDVLIDGRRVVRDRGHVLGDVGALLTEAIHALELPGADPDRGGS